MAPNVLMTGVSGYLGGSIIDHLSSAGLPAHGTIYALVRNDHQAERVRTLYNATPIALDLSDEATLTTQLLEKEIPIVFYLIYAFRAETQIRFINALAAVQEKLGSQAHFLYTSGAKQFIDFAGNPTDRVLNDAEPGLFQTQESAESRFAAMKTAKDGTCSIVEAAEARGVRSYIFIHCIVYGKGTGFGDQIFIQTQAIVRAAKATGRVRKVDDLDGLWPVCHIYDTVTLYVELLRCMLLGKDIGHGKDGYYLAASDRAAWTDIYAALAKALAKRGVIDSAEVADVDMLRWRRWRRSSGAGRRLCLDRTGGLTSVYRCALQADRGKEIGWSPKYGPEHVLEAADDEVELLLQKIQRESLTSWTEEWDMHCCRTSYL